jgi:hypothetical protein
MKSPLSHAHQAIADRLHEEARWWRWRSRLIADRIGELENLELATERTLRSHAGDRVIAEAVLHLRETISDAELWLFREEHDYAESLCERAERELIVLRRSGREAGDVL